jgi:DNA-binding CsgD family transcriptional regulator
LDRLQTYTLLTDEDWSNFKKLFEKLNPGFFDFFIENFPEVTNAEVRLAALIKLNLSNLEMARTLGISPDSVRKTNLRLRKKLTIEGLDELTLFIKQI